MAWSSSAVELSRVDGDEGSPGYQSRTWPWKNCCEAVEQRKIKIGWPRVKEKRLDDEKETLVVMVMTTINASQMREEQTL